MKHWMTAVAVLAMSGVALAAESGEAAASIAMPTVPTETIWAGVMVRVLIGLFIAAAAIGPLVRILMPPAPEPVVAHDDHSDHGHGHDDHGHGSHGH